MLDPEERERLALLIRERALCYSVAWADAEEIDSINILQATMLAMRRALLGLAVPPQQVFVDGNRCPCADGLGFECLFEAVIKGDASVPSISAASILAKTTRDALMRDLDHRYPGFSLSGHKGYPTPSHVAALNALGPSPLHRRSFAPVRPSSYLEDADVLLEGLSPISHGRRRFGGVDRVAGRPERADVGCESSSPARAASSGLLMK